MEHRFRHLLLIQAVLATAGSSAGTFGIVYLAKDGVAPGEGFPAQIAPLFYLFGFLFASVFCVVMSLRRSVSSKRSMALGLLSLSLTYGCFAVFHGLVLITVVPILYGMSIAQFWLPFNALIIRKTTLSNRGARMGLSFLVFTITGVAAPALAGMVVSIFGYSVLFSIGMGLLLMDIVLVFLLIDGKDRMTFDIRFRDFGARNSMAMFLEGSYEGLSVSLIPLITLLFVTAERDLGLIFSVFALAGGAMSLALGFMSDRISHRNLFMWSGAVASGVFALMVALSSNLGAFVAGNSLLQLTGSVAPMFIFAMVADAREDDPATVSATREALLNAGRAFSISIYAVIAVAGVGLQTAFIATSVYLVLMLVGKSSNHNKAQG